VDVRLYEVVNNLRKGQVTSSVDGRKMVIYTENGVIYRFGFAGKRRQLSILVGLIEIIIPVSCLSVMSSTEQTLLTLKKLTI
jgi:hypothetical protein